MKMPLANSELAIMDLLWKNDQLTAREIREKLYSKATKAQHGTVQKLLQRLEDKGFITRDRSEFVHRFAARISRKQYAGSQLEDLASKLTAGSLAPLITHLVETKKISNEDIEQIRSILDDHKKDEGK
ncbi:MAG: BlaI/MecI/CopY family transcriptional regulator [Pyrinomonadaceae bacterium]|nr:BlaI/MecI/CopY family transcriptional regulator [Pyrinomonadaceae bacterium]